MFGRKVFSPMPVQTYYWYIIAKYYDPEHHRFEQAFAGPYSSEQEAYQDANKKYGPLVGSEYKLIKSRSRNRDVARNEHRNEMVEDGEGDVAQVLNVRFRRG